ncbi:MAG: DUF4335 domain-containing protein [Cyanobacteria bacterium P01_H01_bin.15]
MFAVNRILRRYTPPTCTLEIAAAEMPVRSWGQDSVSQNLHFSLRFDDPRHPQIEQGMARGDRQQLDDFCTTVSDYVQGFLACPQTWPLSGEDPLELAPEGETESAIATLSPPQTPYFETVGLLSHRLHLGVLTAADSEETVELSATQLYDLADALEAYQADADSLVVESVPRRNRGAIGGLLAAFVLTLGGLGGWLWYQARSPMGQLALQGTADNLAEDSDGSGPETEQFGERNNIEIPPPPAEIPDSESFERETPLVPPPEVSLAPPPDSTTLDSLGIEPTTPSVEGAPLPLPAVPQSPVLSIPAAPPAPPTATPRSFAEEQNDVVASIPPPVPVPALPPELPTLKSAPSTNLDSGDIALNSPARGLANNDIGVSSNLQQQATVAIPNQTDSNDLAIATPGSRQSFARRRFEPAEESAPSAVAKASNSSQLTEAKNYFSERWQPPETLTQSLEYRLEVAPDGTVTKISPLGQNAAIFLDRSGVPLLGEQFVSPLPSSEPVQIRVVLLPDGDVHTFQESLDR